MIKFSVEGLGRTIQRLEREAEKRTKAVQHAMAGITVDLQRDVKGKLNGPVLHVRTGNLRNSVHQSVKTSGSVVEGSVYTTLSQNGKGDYARVHEYGGTVSVPAHIRRVTYSESGDRVKSKSKKAFLQQEQMVRAHKATYPERSYMRSTLKDSKTRILERLSAAAKGKFTEGATGGD